jgi:hypothetical protein
MKKSNILKNLKLNTPQMILIIIVVLVIIFGFTNLFCNMLGLGRKCDIKEKFEVRTTPCSDEEPCSDEKGDYTIGGVRIPHSHNPTDYSGADETNDPLAYQHKKDLEHAVAHGWINSDGSENYVDNYFNELSKQNYGKALDNAVNVSSD